MNSFEYNNQGFSFHKPSKQLVELFTEFVKKNLFTLRLGDSIKRDDVKKNYILQLFVGAFPELTNLSEGTKDGLTAGYNKMIELDNFIDDIVEKNLRKTKTGGSKKRKQVYKKKSNKSRKTKKLN